jgi:hypothetical protein
MNRRVEKERLKQNKILSVGKKAGREDKEKGEKRKFWRVRSATATFSVCER